MVVHKFKSDSCNKIWKIHELMNRIKLIILFKITRYPDLNGQNLTIKSNHNICIKGFDLWMKLWIGKRLNVKNAHNVDILLTLIILSCVLWQGRLSLLPSLHCRSMQRGTELQIPFNSKPVHKITCWHLIKFVSILMDWKFET